MTSPVDSFTSLNLKRELLANLDSLGYTSMTPIQAQSLPEILAGKDVIAQGKDRLRQNSRLWVGDTAKT